MSTRITTTPPKVGVVAQVGRTIGCMNNAGDQLLFRADSAAHAEYQASLLRGLLADAYLAGQADERVHVKCDETITTLGIATARLVAELEEIAASRSYETRICGDVPVTSCVTVFDRIESAIATWRAVDTERPAYAITADDLTEYAGRPLTDDELFRFADAFPNTSVRDCITGCLDSILESPR